MGRRLRTEHLEVRATGSPFLYPRIGVIVGKHGHSIVHRNRLKRRLRELVRTILMPGIGLSDIIVMSLPSAYRASFADLESEVREMLAVLSPDAG